MRSFLRGLLLATSLAASTAAWATAPTDAELDRLTDLVVQAMPFGQVFDRVAAADPKWPLGEKAGRATPAQLACLRSELSTAGYRRSKHKDVVAYANAHPGDVADDIQLLDAGAAELFGKFVLAGADGEASGKPADTNAIVAAATAAQGLALMTLATGEKYADLRRLIGMGGMFDQLAKGDAEVDMKAKGKQQGVQIGALLMIGAVGTCNLPMSALQ